MMKLSAGVCKDELLFTSRHKSFFSRYDSRNVSITYLEMDIFQYRMSVKTTRLPSSSRKCRWKVRASFPLLGS